MEQLGLGPRWEQPDRADDSQRPPEQARREARGCPGEGDEREPRGAQQDQSARAPGARGPGHPVVIGYDASPSSRNALAYAAGLARRLGRPLLVVYVIPFGVYCEPMTGQVICALRDRGELDSWLLS